MKNEGASELIIVKQSHLQADIFAAVCLTWPPRSSSLLNRETQQSQQENINIHFGRYRSSVARDGANGNNKSHRLCFYAFASPAWKRWRRLQLLCKQSCFQMQFLLRWEVPECTTVPSLLLSFGGVQTWEADCHFKYLPKREGSVI